tara:strand:- start:1810 stop:1953 length:144 start_codon:yes stop_codon:yes gene_type:complete
MISHNVNYVNNYNVLEVFSLFWRTVTFDLRLFVKMLGAAAMLTECRY